MTSDTNPSHVNPDFLRANEVIPPEWSVVRPVTLEAGVSRVNYENGFSVSATDNNVFFNQRHLEDPDVELAVPYVAGRYLDYPPEYLRFNSIGIGLAFIIVGPAQAELSSLLSALAVPYRDTVPNVFLRSMYRLRNMRVNITIGEGPSRSPVEAPSLNIRGQVTYRVPERTPPDDLEFVRMTLSGWESASEPFLEIAQSLCARHPGTGV